MIADLDISETDEGLLLRRLAAFAVERVEDLQARMLAAETDEAAVALNAACVKAERSARQSIALRIKFVHDHARAVREQEAHDRAHRADRERERKEQVARRRSEVHVRVERAIWDEHEAEPELAHELVGDLHDVLDEETELSTFLEEPLDAQVERIRHILSVDGRRRWQEPDDDEPRPPFVRTPGRPGADSS